MLRQLCQQHQLLLAASGTCGFHPRPFQLGCAAVPSVLCLATFVLLACSQLSYCYVSHASVLRPRRIYATALFSSVPPCDPCCCPATCAGAFVLQCVELKSDWAKGYSRLGAAYYGLQEWENAIKAYEDGKQLLRSMAQASTAQHSVRQHVHLHKEPAPRSMWPVVEMMV